MYVEDLVGPDTVNTMPMATLLAAGDRAEIPPRDRRRGPPAELDALADAGIDMDDVTDSCCARASTSSSSRWTSCSTASAPSARRSSPSGRPRSTPRSRRGRRAARGQARRAGRRGGRRPAHLAQGRHALGPRRPARGGQPPGVADRGRADARGARRPAGLRRGRARRWRQGRRAAGHGRLVAGPRGHPALIRRAARLAEPARARLHRRRRRAQRRDRHRPRPRAVPRLHEVGRDDRDAVAVQALLVAAAGRQRLRRHHRSGLGPGEARERQ